MRVQIATIDLADATSSLAFADGYLFLRVLVCDHGSPVGELWFDARNFPGEVPPERVRHEAETNLGWEHWRRLVARQLTPDPSEHELPPITVAVCTKDRPESLARCLASLAMLEYPVHEVLVVDNASTDPAVKKIAMECRARYVHEPRVGLDWARNTAIEHAAHGIVAFCDDDVQVSPRWLHGIAAGFADPRTAVVTGLVLPAELETSWQWEFERYGGMAKGFRPFSVDHELLAESEWFTSSRWGVGANMAFRRDVARAVGLFDVGLDVGTASGGGGDIEMLWRIVAAGHRLRYMPDAWVRHAHRRDRASLIRQIDANGRAYGCFLRTVAERDPRLRGAVRRHTTTWVRGWLVRQVAAKIRHRDRFGATLAIAELRGALGSGAAYRKTRALAPLPTPVPRSPS